ncbi:MAG: dihydropteridine reductase [Clostridia bacterium]|nr:dihydropteridine reductase [Clostridia bacterium]
MSDNEKEAVRRIQEEYMPKEQSKMETLLTLNAKVKTPAEIFAYTFGTIGALVLGTGMCFAMKVIGAALSFAMPMGIAIGAVGIAMVTANWFLYKKILKSRKKKYADEVLALTDELLAE